ncbi:hypothetical protein DFP72DRAFT_850654 [Ephemerocybe angulata]|uniref:Uncharacterized protein n=1 Tax=Ephemerocybe angulata TaxID=980116 RepID=A0A8H6HQW1_9AGAR|nr:hypothetical protein DFP72DRAFT_850654 [Tulosesus angulatus]
MGTLPSREQRESLSVSEFTDLTTGRRHGIWSGDVPKLCPAELCMFFNRDVYLGRRMVVTRLKRPNRLFSDPVWAFQTHIKQFPTPTSGRRARSVPRHAAINRSKPNQPSSHSSPHHHSTLSQTHPDLLDYEHGIELLSPPSSRSESPFSVVGGTSSPNLGDPTPHGTPGSTATTSAYLSLSDEGSESDSANPSHQTFRDILALLHVALRLPAPRAAHLHVPSGTNDDWDGNTGATPQPRWKWKWKARRTPVSPAVSTTSTTFSELEADSSEGWSDVDGAEALDREIETLGFTRSGTGTLRRK